MRSPTQDMLRCAVVIVALSLVAPSAARSQDLEAPAEASPSDASNTPHQDAAVAEATGPSWLVVPLILYTPETSLLFTLGALVSFPDDPSATPAQDTDTKAPARPSTILPSATYTLRNQVLTRVASDLFFWSGDAHINAVVSYSYTTTDFFDVGNDSPPDPIENFWSHRVRVTSLQEHRVVGQLYAGLTADVWWETIARITPGGRMDQGAVTGSEGARLIAPGLSISFDDRDSSTYPTQGGRYELRARLFDGAFGSSHDFADVTTDLRHYLPVAQDHTFAMRLLATVGAGDAPFQALPMLGGSNLLRGHFRGRFSDRSLLAAQVEHRWYLGWRLGVVGFGGVGQVMRDIDQARLDRFHPTGGAGLRFMVNQESNVNFRLDAGFGADAWGVYFSALEAF